MINKLIKILAIFISLIILTDVKGENIYIKSKNNFENYNFTNLVVLAKFDKEDEFIDDIYSNTKVREIIDNMYNASEYSIANYFNIVSNDKVRMNNIFLFDDNHSLTLKRERGYYAEYSDENLIGYSPSEESLRMLELKEDWSEAINAVLAKQNKLFDFEGNPLYDYSELDKNKDGKIDSITIIYKTSPSNISVSWSSPLWNYQDQCSFVNVNVDGKTLYSDKYVQLTNMYSYLYKDSLGKKIISLGASTHEMGHIFGLKDLYKSQNQSPVYYMSLMGKAMSPIPQYITSKEKEALGWYDDNQLINITKSGTYTIHATKSTKQDEVIAYKVQLENEKTLYLEYRNFESTNNKFDSQNKYLVRDDGTSLPKLNIKSGLVCLLANSNTKFPNNMYVYGTQWDYQALGGIYATKSDCALEEDDELFVDSNTSIYVTSMDENSLTFEIEGTFLDVKPVVTGITFSNYIEEMKRGDSYQFAAKIEGTNISEKKVTWKIENNTSSHTSIDEDGLLVIGSDENSDCLTVIASVDDFSISKIIKLNIVHELKHYNFKDSTCTDLGNIEYWYCEECDKYFKDANHENEISKDNIIINKKDHALSEWIIDKYPTYTEDGQRHKECVNCHEMLEIEFLSHIISPSSSSSISSSSISSSSMTSSSSVSSSNTNSYSTSSSSSSITSSTSTSFSSSPFMNSSSNSSSSFSSASSDNNNIAMYISIGVGIAAALIIGIVLIVLFAI